MSGLASPAYLVPEIILQKESTTKIDMWALGIILYQLSTGKLPFEAATNKET